MNSELNAEVIAFAARPQTKQLHVRDPSMLTAEAVRSAEAADQVTQDKRSSETKQRQSAASENGKQQVEKADVEEAVERLRDYVQQIDRKLEFSVDEDSGETVIKVFDSSSEELIRQIPSDEILKLARDFENPEKQDAPGLLVTERV